MVMSGETLLPFLPESSGGYSQAHNSNSNGSSSSSNMSLVKKFKRSGTGAKVFAVLFVVTGVAVCLLFGAPAPGFITRFTGPVEVSTRVWPKSWFFGGIKPL